MRIALQISGQQRYGDFFPQLLSAFDGCDLDIFVHNWSGPRSEEELRDLIGPQLVGLAVEPQIAFEVPPEWKKLVPQGSSIFNLVSMTYGIREANRLRVESGRDYDAVVRARSDIRLLGPITIPPAPLIELGKRPYFLPFGKPEIQDQFAIGDPAVMDLYAGLYDHLGDFHAEGRKFHPETYFAWWLHKCGIVVSEDSGLIVQMDKIEMARELRAVY
jgi:hypothetical protein